MSEGSEKRNVPRSLNVQDEKSVKAILAQSVAAIQLVSPVSFHTALTSWNGDYRDKGPHSRGRDGPAHVPQLPRAWASPESASKQVGFVHQTVRLKRLGEKPNHAKCQVSPAPCQHLRAPAPGSAQSSSPLRLLLLLSATARSPVAQSGCFKPRQTDRQTGAVAQRGGLPLTALKSAWTLVKISLNLVNLPTRQTQSWKALCKYHFDKLKLFKIRLHKSFYNTVSTNSLSWCRSF